MKSRKNRAGPGFPGSHMRTRLVLPASVWDSSPGPRCGGLLQGISHISVRCPSTRPQPLVSSTATPLCKPKQTVPTDHIASADLPGQTVQCALELRRTESHTAGRTLRAQRFSPKSLPRASLGHRPFSARHRAQVTLCCPLPFPYL